MPVLPTKSGRFSPRDKSGLWATRGLQFRRSVNPTGGANPSRGIHADEGGKNSHVRRGRSIDVFPAHALIAGSAIRGSRFDAARSATATGRQVRLFVVARTKRTGQVSDTPLRHCTANAVEAGRYFVGNIGRAMLAALICGMKRLPCAQPSELFVARQGFGVSGVPQLFGERAIVPGVGSTTGLSMRRRGYKAGD